MATSLKRTVWLTTFEQHRGSQWTSILGETWDPHSVTGSTVYHTNSLQRKNGTQIDNPVWSGLLTIADRSAIMKHPIPIPWCVNRHIDWYSLEFAKNRRKGFERVPFWNRILTAFIYEFSPDKIPTRNGSLASWDLTLRRMIWAVDLRQDLFSFDLDQINTFSFFWFEILLRIKSFPIN